MVFRSRDAELVTTSCFALSRSSRRSRVGIRPQGCASNQAGVWGLFSFKWPMEGASDPHAWLQASSFPETAREAEAESLAPTISDLSVASCSLSHVGEATPVVRSRLVPAAISSAIGSSFRRRGSLMPQGLSIQ